MHTSSIELYDLLKTKLGEKEAKTLVTFIEAEVESKLESKKDVLATKNDLHQLDLKIERVRADLIKWMFIFLVGQAGVIIGVLITAIRLFVK